MKAVHITAFVLVVVGALNLGLVGLFDFNLIGAVFGTIPWLERLINVLIGVAAVALLATHKKDCKSCMEGAKPTVQSPPSPPPIT
jgi:uncharacterized protein